MKSIVKVALFIFIFASVSPVFAEEKRSSEMGEEKCCSKMGMCSKHDMMKMMTGKKMVGTEDNGVIIMMGNKLLKYDKDLNLVKEAEIKIDMEGMKKMMMEMKQKGHECGQMKQQGK